MLRVHDGSAGRTMKNEENLKLGEMDDAHERFMAAPPGA